MQCMVLKNKGRKVGLLAHLFFILWFLALSHLGHGQSASQQVMRAYHDVLRLKINDAHTRLAAIAPSSSELPLYLYTENLADILTLLLTEDRALYDAKKDNEKQRLKRLQSLPDGNPYKEFCMAEIRLQWAFVKLKFGDVMTATWGLTQAYKTIQRNDQKFPAFVPNKKTLGLLNSVFGAVPQQYHWLLGILGLKGSTVEGRAQLATIAEARGMFALEAQIMLHLIDVYLMDGGKATQKVFQQLALNEPENKLMYYLYAMISIKTNEAEEALTVLEAMDTLSEDYLSIPMEAYLKGEIYLQKGLYEHSSARYNEFLTSYKGDNFVKDGYYKLFLSNWLSGDERQAEHYFDLAKRNGTTSAEADKYAARQIAANARPERTILKIRLATDGGYYKRAEALVNAHSEADFHTPHDQVEFAYRKARLSDKQGKASEAIQQYLETIEKSGKNQWYYAPNAALQLGYLYLQKGNPNLAKAYFEKAMSYEGHEYKNSIDHKAKIALQQMQ